MGTAIAGLLVDIRRLGGGDVVARLPVLRQSFFDVVWLRGAAAGGCLDEAAVTEEVGVVGRRTGVVVVALDTATSRDVTERGVPPGAARRLFASLVAAGAAAARRRGLVDRAPLPAPASTVGRVDLSSACDAAVMLGVER